MKTKHDEGKPQNQIKVGDIVRNKKQLFVIVVTKINEHGEIYGRPIHKSKLSFVMWENQSDYEKIAIATEIVERDYIPKENETTKQC
jgi:hypothetical protein